MCCTALASTTMLPRNLFPGMTPFEDWIPMMDISCSLVHIPTYPRTNLPESPKTQDSLPMICVYLGLESQDLKTSIHVDIDYAT